MTPVIIDHNGHTWVSVRTRFGVVAFECTDQGLVDAHPGDRELALRAGVDLDDLAARAERHRLAVEQARRSGHPTGLA